MFYYVLNHIGSNESETFVALKIIDLLNHVLILYFLSAKYIYNIENWIWRFPCNFTNILYNIYIITRTS